MVLVLSGNLYSLNLEDANSLCEEFLSIVTGFSLIQFKFELESVFELALVKVCVRFQVF